MQTIAEALREALAITRRAIDAGTIQDANIAVSLRAPALERAQQAKEAGEPWTAAEDELAQELMALDLRLIQTLWDANADAFEWLRGRDEANVAEMPHLRQLSES